MTASASPRYKATKQYYKKSEPSTDATSSVEPTTAGHEASNERTPPPTQPSASVKKLGNCKLASPPTSEEDYDEEDLKYGAVHVVKLFVPVSICMAFVVLLTRLVAPEVDEKDEGRKSAGSEIADSIVGEGSDTSAILLKALILCGFMIVMVIAMTFVLILLYKYRFYKVIYGWLFMGSFVMLFLFTLQFTTKFVRKWNCGSMSVTGVFFLLYNNLVVGLLMIYWKGPLLMHQAYLIICSALACMTFSTILYYEYAVYILLALISIWDLIAVLTPKGPLRILVETAQERNEPLLPSLVYSSNVLYAYTFMMSAYINDINEGRNNTRTTSGTTSAESPAHRTASIEECDTQKSSVRAVDATAASEESVNAENVGTTGPASANLEEIDNIADTPGAETTATPAGTDATDQPNEYRSSRRQAEGADPATLTPQNTSKFTTKHSVRVPRAMKDHVYEEEEERGVKLGLGDFVFYSLLASKALTDGDLTTMVGCYVCILVGLALTLVLLGIWKKALPALPISISLGLAFFFSAKFIIHPFMSEIGSHGMVL